MKLLQPLFALFASASDRDLVRMIEYLKAENRILRDKLPARITVTPRERSRLLRLGQKVGSSLRDLITIVSYRTFSRWLAAAKGKPKTTTVDPENWTTSRTPLWGVATVVVQGGCE